MDSRRTNGGDVSFLDTAWENWGFSFKKWNYNLTRQRLQQQNRENNTTN